MQNHKTGGYAFPGERIPGDSEGPRGMFLRDYFASQAMLGFLANSHFTKGLIACGYDSKEQSDPIVAAAAYHVADEMLKARDA